MPIGRMLMINVAHGLDHLVMMLFPVIAALAASSFAEDYATLLTLTTGCWFAFGAGTLPAGWIADRWSRKGMMAIFFLGCGVALLLTAAAQSFWQIAAALFVLGLFASIYHPVGIAMLASGSTENLGKRLALNGVFGNLGVAASTAFAGVVAELLGWRMAFIMPAIVCIALGLLWLATVPAAEVDVPKRRDDTPHDDAPPPFAWKRVLAIMISLAALLGFIFNASVVSLPEVFDERLGTIAESPMIVGFLASGVYLVAGLAQIVVGTLIDKYPAKPIFLAIMGAMVVAMAAMTAVEGAAVLVIAVVMLLLVYATLPISDAIIGRNAPAHLRSRIFAVVYVLSFLAAMAAIEVIAALHAWTGDFAALFTLMTVLAAIFAAGISLLPGHRRSAAPMPAE